MLPSLFARLLMVLSYLIAIALPSNGEARWLAVATTPQARGSPITILRQEALFHHQLGGHGTDTAPLGPYPCGRWDRNRTTALGCSRCLSGCELSCSHWASSHRCRASAGTRTHRPRRTAGSTPDAISS